MDTRLLAFHLTYTYNTRNDKSIIFSVVTKQLENTMYGIEKKENKRKKGDAPCVNATTN
jgi:hypothetical protein